MRQSNSHAHYYALAASVAALAVAAPAALYMLRPNPPSGPTSANPNPGKVAQTAPVDATAHVLSDLKLKADEEAEKQRVAIAAPRSVAEQDARVGPPATAAAGQAAATNRVEPTAAPQQQTSRGDMAAPQPQKSAAKPTVEGRLATITESLAAAPPPAVLAPLPAPAVPSSADRRQKAESFAALPDQATTRAKRGYVDGMLAAGHGGVAPPAFVGGQIAGLDQLRPDAQPRPKIEENRDQFETKDANPVKSVTAEPVSTFSIDVDTASYAVVRRALNGGRLPQKAAVRIEEMINYFPYDYPRPEGAEVPFQSTIQVFPSPWNASNQLVHIAIKGHEIKAADRPRANLVLLVDISGSMGPDDRLPLLKNSFRMLLDNLKPDDSVAIVTYASGSDVRLPATKVADKARILAAIDSLNAGGSTAGAAGITDAYKVAEAGFDKAAVNRVILATDGDWNVGITNREELKGFIERKRQTGIYMSILGVGMGNHNDALMQTLAQNGNGTAAYIDTLNEARKVLVDEASSTLFPIARDVKIQLEFNPRRVAEYRLVGYETRMLKREDFNNDKVDAGDVGSGHAVTAIYEITPVGAPKLVDDLRYQRPDQRPGQRPAPAATPPVAADARDDEIGFLKLRYKLPKEEASRLATFSIGEAQVKRTIADASTEARFSTAVAAFGQLLRGLSYTQGYGFDDVIALAAAARGEDAFGYRAEFVNLVRLAKSARP